MYSNGNSDSKVVSILAEIAEEKLRDIDRIADHGISICVEVAPELGTDDAVLADSQRSMRANLECFLTHLSRGEPGFPTDTPREALEMGKTILRRGGDPEVIIRAYHRGPQWSISGWMHEISRRAEDRELMVKVLEEFSARVFAYTDFLVDQVIKHYREEHARWIGGAMAHRTETVRSILNEEGPFGVEEASQALAYELGRPLVPLVLWSTDEQADSDQTLADLERLSMELARDLGTQRALSVAAGTSTVWSWIGLNHELAIDDVAAKAAKRCGKGSFMAIGTIASGLVGLRTGHAEAEHAREIANTDSAHGPVFRYDELELVTLMSGDRDRMKRFIRRTLGGLANQEEGAQRLRETLIEYFAAGANARSAAERLHMHKNTVLYRLRSAEDLLGHPIDQGRLELELALRLIDVLGEDQALAS